jgi:hypothetical protein
LPSSTLLPSANIFATSPSGSPGLSSPPKKPSFGGPVLEDPFILKTAPDEKIGTVADRRQAMFERVSATSSVLMTAEGEKDETFTYIRLISWSDEVTIIHCRATRGAEKA